MPPNPPQKGWEMQIEISNPSTSADHMAIAVIHISDVMVAGVILITFIFYLTHVWILQRPRRSTNDGVVTRETLRRRI